MAAAKKTIRQIATEHFVNVVGYHPDEARDHVAIMVDTGELKPGMSHNDAIAAVGAYVHRLDLGSLPDAHLYAPEAPAQEAEPQQADVDFSMLPLPNYSESPVVVYPMPNGGFIYKGIAYSVTFRDGGTAEHALYLLREWERLYQLVGADGAVAPSCKSIPVQNNPAKPAQPAKASNVTQFTQASGATRDRNELDDVFEEPASGEPMTEQEITIWQKALQADLDKNPKTQGQTVAAVDAVKVIKAKKNGIAFLYGGMEVIAAFDNRTSDDDAEWKNPIAKLPDGLRLDYSTAQNGVIFKLSEPMFVALKQNGDFKNFQRVLRFEGKWSVA